MKEVGPARDSWPNMLLIAGTGRNSGKTGLAVRIIRRLAPGHDITAVKVSPHFHRGTPGLEAVVRTGHFNIYLEKAQGKGKDSERMAAAGARNVYYMEAEDIHLAAAFEALARLLPRSKPVIIESPALAQLLKPGLFLITDHPLTGERKPDVVDMKPGADMFINTAMADLDAIVGRLVFEDARWRMRDERK